MAGWVESAVIAVVISSFVTVAGWFVAHGSERRLEAARRQEKIQDFQTALLADIRGTASRFANFDYDAHLDQVLALIESAPFDRPYSPFVPREPGSLIWPSIAGEVHILPNEVIDAIVVYFSQLETIRLFVEDLRTDLFGDLEPYRKAEMYRDCTRMSKYLIVLAEEAELTLARSLGLSPPISSSISGPSSRSGASAREAEAKDGV
jgi:hypothetical protein